MSKADQPTTLIPSRRALLVGVASAAALPIAAALPVAAPALAATAPAGCPEATDPVIALAERTIAAWKEFEAKCLVTSKAEDLVIDWKNLNPRPELRACTVGTTEEYLAFQTGLSTFDPNADLTAAAEEQQRLSRNGMSGGGRSKRRPAIPRPIEHETEPAAVSTKFVTGLSKRARPQLPACAPRRMQRG
jgi:hypothetical protein